MTAREMIEALHDPDAFDPKNYLSQKSDIGRSIQRMGYEQYTPQKYELPAGAGTRVYRKVFTFNPPLAIRQSLSRADYARVFVKESTGTVRSHWCRVRVRFGYNNPELGPRVFNGHYFSKTLEYDPRGYQVLTFVDSVVKLLQKVERALSSTKGELAPVESKLRHGGFRAL
jgi:hypothetical protein